MQQRAGKIFVPLTEGDVPMPHCGIGTGGVHAKAIFVKNLFIL